MTIKSYDPSNGELVGEVTKTPLSDVEAIVAASHFAQREWQNTSVDDRVQYLEKAAELIMARTQSLAELLSREMGKDLRRSTSEVMGVAQGLAYFAQQVRDAIQVKHVSGGLVEYVPLGVAAIISPWNYPLAMANNLIVPALVAGNSVVFKPSEETPLIAQNYFEILNTVLPENVIQILHGDKEIGKTIVEANVNIIGFTGSMEAGKDIMRRAAGGMKRLVMELGGNDPMVVMPDADVIGAARFAVASSFENAGQMCTSTERIYVDQKIADRFEQEVVKLAAQYKVGPWHQQGVNIGPIITERQRAKIIDHIDDALGKGAQALVGGKDHPEHYITPTVLTGVTPDMRMSYEETFGPVVSISRVADTNEAIRLANDSDYGLGAVVFGGKEAVNVGRKLEAGMVGINSGPGGGADSPWVGAKQSGFGFHGSADGHRQFTQVRVIG